MLPDGFLLLAAFLMALQAQELNESQLLAESRLIYASYTLVR